MTALRVVALALAITWLGCSSGSNKCVAGQSVACTGVGGCSGGQVCNADGTYGPCQCGTGNDAGSGSDSGTPDGGASDSGAPDSGMDAGNGWTPAQITSLVLWLQGGTAYLDGGAMAWPDSSPRVNTFAQSSSEPSLNPTGIDSRPAVHFTGAMGQNLTGPVTTDFAWGTSNFLIAVVAKPGSCPGMCPVWSGSDGNFNPPVLLEFTDGGAGLAAAASIATASGLGTSAPLSSGAHLLAVHRTGSTTAEVRVDGVATAFTLSSNVNLSFPESGSLGVYENTFQNITAFYDGDIAEVVAATAPTSGEISQLETYLMQKYGL